MIDMHTHILFGVDDGPEELSGSMKMLRQAAEEGITEIIATSHACHPQFHVDANRVYNGVDQLREAAGKEGLGIRLHAGHEIRLNANLPERLDAGEILTLAGSKFVMLELPSQGVPDYTVGIIQDLMNRGLIPVIAHPERNKAIVEKPQRLYRLVNHGALAQVTAGAVCGTFGSRIKDAALTLIDSHLVHFYGSDAHNTDKRGFHFDEGLSYLEKKGRADMVDIMLENNARILEKRDPVLLEPEDPKGKKKWFIFG
ncbi:protein-tyrosine phosphatase [Bhargavaea beijingensis]|uniref:Tyrosine-protein phosphatase n=1 Tax=Bhargavaea beijingensis TaxID=426756 RepID=A0A1G6Z9K6_9BACL|nr:CpsB/CapC family capsule biosynthesis tyrosine phosphatase [Bhargavaea beijingensis]SDD98973.1 protein-tyrosine phosphatase [Bhargavaea beijingensis]